MTHCMEHHVYAQMPIKSSSTFGQSHLIITEVADKKHKLLWLPTSFLKFGQFKTQSWLDFSCHR